MKKMKFIALFILVFLVGMFSGALVTGFFIKKRIHNYFNSSPETKRSIALSRLSKRLDLNDKEKAKVKGHMKALYLGLEEFKSAHKPDIEKLIHTFDSGMQKDLDGPSKVKYLELKNDWKPRLKKVFPGLKWE